MTEPERELREWGELLKKNWERRAASSSRDFFVASHPGWTDSERWDAQAKHDVEHIMTGLDASRFPSWDVLEIGCGVGRLAKPLAEKVQTYTGFDIAPSMVEEARRRNAERTNCRFFVADGTSIPDEVRDRSYHFALALGVFIHLPRAVIRALSAAVYELLEPGAQLRYQVLADPTDPTAVPQVEAAEVVHEQAVEMEAGATEEQRALIDGQYFMGDAFRYDEVAPFFESAAPDGIVHTVRLDLAHVYGWIEKPESA